MKKDELALIFELFKRISQLSSRCWTDFTDLDGENLHETTRNNYNYLINYTGYRPLAEEEIDGFKQLIEKTQLIPHPDTSIQVLKYLYLPPLEEDRDFIPLISARINFGSEIPQLSLRVGLFKSQAGQQPIFFGVRFETGHYGQDLSSKNHNFCHLQLVEQPFTQSRLITCFSGLPKHYPAVLIPATCPTTLILCMLVSMYGIKIRNTSLFYGLKLNARYNKPFEFLGYSTIYPNLPS